MMAGTMAIGDFLHRIKRPIELEQTKLYKLVTVKLAHKGVVLREEKPGQEIKSKMYEVKQGDFILSGIDARNGAFGIVPPELDGAIVTNDFWYFDIDRDLVDKHFFLELTSTRWFDEICRKGSDGTTQRIRLQKHKFFNQQVTIPSIDEQKTFVTRFHSFKYKRAALQSELSHQQTLLKKLRQQILQEAIEGKLTADWRAANPDEEPASDLLKRIAAEKAELVKAKKIKPQKPLPPISEEEKPFELPEGWEWCRIDDITIVVGGMQKTPARQPRKDFVSYVGVQNVQRGYLDLAQVKKFETTKEEAQKLLLKIGDLLIIEGNGSFTEIGRCAIWNDEIKPCIHQNHVIRARPIFPDFGTYLILVLNAPFGINQMQLRARTTTGLYNLSVGKIRSLTCPFPTPKEQRAIVAKVEKLLSLCDELERHFTRNQNYAETLMEAVLREAFLLSSADALLAE